MNKFRNNSPLPHLEKEIRTADERESIGVDPKRRKFSARDMLNRIARHKPGEPVALRDGDEPFHQILEDSGLVNLSGAVATRSDLDVPEQSLEVLTFTLEAQILAIRKKLENADSAKATD
ncbi:hypothetical protein HZA44_01600 [Candidatus Peregrinibacteria bacterium]|nr:hypothetical protein [Candidatus Peregrinibacteria bacterium]